MTANGHFARAHTGKSVSQVRLLFAIFNFTHTFIFFCLLLRWISRFQWNFTWILEYGSFKTTPIFKSIVFLDTDIYIFKACCVRSGCKCIFTALVITTWQTFVLLLTLTENATEFPTCFTSYDVQNMHWHIPFIFRNYGLLPEHWIQFAWQRTRSYNLFGIPTFYLRMTNPLHRYTFNIGFIVNLTIWFTFPTSFTDIDKMLYTLVQIGFDVMRVKPIYSFVYCVRPYLRLAYCVTAKTPCRFSCDMHTCSHHYTCKCCDFVY